MTSALGRDLGVTQGRIQPRGWTPPSGLWALVLGSDVPGIKVHATSGDTVNVTQTADVTGLDCIGFRAHLRGPATMPTGASWVLAWSGGDWSSGSRVILPGQTYDVTLSMVDVSQLTGDQELLFQLTLVSSGHVEVELPGVYLDALALISHDPLAPAVLVDSFPENGQENVPLRATIVVGISDIRPGGAGINDSVTSIYLVTGGEETLIYNDDLGGWGAFWTGTITNPYGLHSRYTFTCSKDMPSDSVLGLHVFGLTLDGIPFDFVYSFRTRDATAPTVIAAQATGLRTVRVAFSEPMRTFNGVVSEALGAPAYTPNVISIVQATPTTWDVAFDAELSPGVQYRLFVLDATDLAGNGIQAPDNEAVFTAIYPAQPTGRDIDLYRMLPTINREEDETGDLQKFVACLQEVFVLLLADVDTWGGILDPDRAPERAVDNMLLDLGNPFAFDLSLTDKRRLTQLLVPLYKQKGTNRGIKNAVRFFMSLEVEVTQYLGSGVELGEAELDDASDIAWELGPAGTFSTYSFDVTVLEVLTPTQRGRLRAIVDYMKPAHTHFVHLREPEVPVVPDHVELGLSELGGDEFLLH